MFTHVRIVLPAIFAFVVSLSTSAETISVPNGSFEAPVVDPTVAPAYPFFDPWQHYPKPDWWDEGTQGPWNNLAGVFPNTASGSPDHINNMDQNQGAYLFNATDNGMYQDLTNKFEAGHSYTISAGFVNSSALPTAVGGTLSLTLYYQDAGNKIAIAEKTITFDTTTFSNATKFLFFSAKSAVVKATDSWVGKTIGVSIRSTSAADKMGGVWDVDNVQLVATLETADVPNFSFESPAVDPTVAPAYPFFDAWQKTPKPDYWDEATFGPWSNLTGVFPNQPDGQPGRVVNVDHNQAAYLFGTPGAGFYQNLATTFEPGSSYTLTVGLTSSSFQPLTANSSLLVELYYINDSSQTVPVAATSVVYNAANFPDLTHLFDFSATTAGVTAFSPWAHKPIGVLLVSTAGFDTSGGVWDVDNVRLTVTPALALRATVEGTNLRISWDSSAGSSYQLRGTQDFVTWSDAGSPVGGTGAEVSTPISLSDPAYRFFEVRATP